MRTEPPTSSSSDALRDPSRLPGGPLVWVAIALVAFFSLAISSMSQKSATYDEPVYVVGGLSTLTLRDYTLKEDAPPLIGYLAGLSAWMYGLEIPGGKIPFANTVGVEYPYSAALLFRSELDAREILFYSRLAVLLPFGVLLLVTVYGF